MLKSLSIVLYGLVFIISGLYLPHESFLHEYVRLACFVVGGSLGGVGIGVYIINYNKRFKCQRD